MRPRQGHLHSMTPMFVGEPVRPPSEDARPETAAGRRPCGRPPAYTPVSGPVLSLMRSTFTPTFSSNVSPRFMNGVCRS